MIDDRAQSEILGYILIFSMVMLSVTAVFASGVASMDDQRDTTTLDNAQRGMLVLDDSVRNIYQYDDPSRAVEFQMADTTVELGQQTLMNVTVNDEPTVSLRSRSLSYQTDDGEILYDHGAVIRNEQRGAAVQSDPPIRVTENNRTMIHHVRFFGTPDRYQADSGNALVVLTGYDTRLVRHDSSPDNVTVHIDTTSDRAEAWDRYFDEQPFTPTTENDPSAGIVEYEMTDPERVTFHSTQISVRIRR